MGLDIAFRTKELRALCESPTRAKRLLGDGSAVSLRRHLADIDAFETAAEMIELGLGVTLIERRLVCSLGNDQFLVCEINHHEVPTVGEAVDWSSITRLKIVSIGSER